MLKTRIIVTALTLALTSGIALAQSPAGAPGGAPGGASGGSSSGGSGPPTTGTPPTITPAAEREPTRAQIQTAREACFKEVNAEHMKKVSERRVAMDKCMSDKYPILAKRKECRAQGRAKGLRNIKLRQFIQSCIQS